MIQSVERSLGRLGTDYIDVLYLHMWDYLTPVDEVMRGLDDLVSSGKVLYAAISDTPSWIVAEANTMALLRGWSRFVGLQIPYSIIDRAVERSLLLMAKHWNMTVLPWGILEAGLLSGKFLSDNDEPSRINRKKLKLRDRTVKIIEEVQKVAEETGRSMAQVSINWIRRGRDKPQMFPILGARSADQLDENIASLEWNLEDEHRNRLDKVSEIDMGFPHNFLEASPYIFGATHDKLDRRSS